MSKGWWKEPNSREAKSWIAARTGVPFIDANMEEIKRSGFMSNRGRQNVASFLTSTSEITFVCRFDSDDFIRRGSTSRLASRS